MKEIYELMYVIPLKFAGEFLQPTIDEITNQLKSFDFKITKNELFGKLKFSYKIKNQYQGFFYVVQFSGDSGKLNKFTQWLSIKKEVLRFLVVKVDLSKRSSLELSLKNAELKYGQQKQSEMKDNMEEIVGAKVQNIESIQEGIKSNEPKVAPEVKKEESVEVAEISGSEEENVAEKTSNIKEGKLEKKEDVKDVEEALPKEEKKSEPVKKSRKRVKKVQDNDKLTLDSLDKKLDEILDTDLPTI